MILNLRKVNNSDLYMGTLSGKIIIIIIIIIFIIIIVNNEWKDLNTKRLGKPFGPLCKVENINFVIYYI